MRKICIINQKGGVGKTTTTITLARGLANAGRCVLIIDMDPQGNIAECMGLKEGKDLYDHLIDGKALADCVREIDEHLTVLPCHENLTKAELILAGETARETYLKRKLTGIKGFDYVLLDCPPSLGLLNQNALLYADEAIIPTSTDALGADAVGKMIDAIESMQDVFGHRITISAIVPTLYDARLKTCREFLTQIQNTYYEKVTEVIRANSKLRETPQVKKSIFEHARSSNGGKDYKKVVEFVMQQEVPVQEEPERIAEEIGA